MGKYGRQRRRESKRAAQKAWKEAHRDNIYQPPPREKCRFVEYHYTHSGDSGEMLLTVRSWHFEKKLVDFYLVVSQLDENGMKVRDLASADCVNHGTIHFHNETKPNAHGTRKDIFPIRSADDVDALFDRTLQKLLTYADGVARKGLDDDAYE